MVEETKSYSWTFLTNHTHVLVCLARNPNMVLKDVASHVGITERAVQRIVSELEADGFISRQKEGRRNKYILTLKKSLRHPVEKNCDIKDLVQLLK